jgi:hypothetical protein
VAPLAAGAPAPELPLCASAKLLERASAAATQILMNLMVSFLSLMTNRKAAVARYVPHPVHHRRSRLGGRLLHALTPVLPRAERKRLRQRRCDWPWNKGAAIAIVP